MSEILKESVLYLINDVVYKSFTDVIVKFTCDCCCFDEYLG